jgi:hypothetical protein
MGLFKRKKKNQQSQQPGIACISCGSKNTIVITHHGMDQANYVRVWRGQRQLTCRCLDCRKDFYADISNTEIERQVMGDNRIIDDEEALSEAENELKREADEQNDHRLWS